MLDRLTGYFFPIKDPDEVQHARAQLVVLALIFATFVATGLELWGRVNGFSERTLVPGPGLACCILTLIALRISGSVHVGSQTLAICITAGYGVAAFVSGHPSHLAWVAIMPFVVLLLSEIKWAVVWFFLCFATIAVVCVSLLNDPDRIRLATREVMVARVGFFLVAVFTLMVLSAAGRKRTQRSLEVARDEANRANALKSEFLASFSHEIRTPLNGVLGTADGLLAGELTPEVRAQLLIIQQSGSSLLRTINDVLELSRIEAGRLDLFPVATHLPSLLREVAELFRARATSSGLQLRLMLEPGHPDCVMVDDLRLRQVLQNLVGNAVKFTREGEVVVRLTAGQVVNGQVTARISVEDTGPGIEPEALSRLFSAFTQARPRIDRAEGTGLGLAISSQFIELMEGKLSVDSALGRGSNFHIELTLPLAQAQVVTTPAMEMEPARLMRVLVVDDNEINLKVASTLLSRLGHQVVAARDGEQALAAIVEHQPDVVFMDCHMPVLDGVEATRRLRAAGDGRPVVALTASAYEEDKERCRVAGMNSFVSKPVSLLSLQTALREVTVAPARPSVLVVDDDPHVRGLTVRLLRAEGFEVSDAASVEAALILFERSAPSHLVVDRVLGGPEDGLHFAERLSRQRRGLHVVVTSGRRPSREQLASLEATGGRFLAKPYDRSTLLASFSLSLPGRGSG